MSKEREASAWPGWPVLALTVALYAFAAGVLVHGGVWEVWAGVGAIALAAATSMGFFTLQPNEARALILFGRYTGTTRQVGFLWANPFFSNRGSVLGRLSSARRGSGPEQFGRRLPRYKISLRARTLNGERLKVNDRAGNPIDIAAVVVWHVDDTAQALF
ncbi:MAG TPA: hypothetical protein VL984_01480, partial [Acidimicrobiales bacterium]|nr:hypothetical protein [Acidimicrobiales bacterium]